MNDLIKEIREDLSKELCIFADSEVGTLSSKVKGAYMEVKERRNYPETYQESFIEEDMKRYYSNIRRLALYDYNQIGAEGEKSHNDNTGTRTWVSRETCLEGVVAICTLI